MSITLEEHTKTVQKSQIDAEDPSHQTSPSAMTWLYSPTISNHTLTGKPSEGLKKFLAENDFSIDDLDKKNEKQETALTKAIQLNQDSLAIELVNLGADINKPGQTSITDLGDGEHFEHVMTPLSIASYLNKIEMVNFLLSHQGIELGTHDPAEPHPIEIASYLQHHAVVKALISAGANPKSSVAPTLIHLLTIVHVVYTFIHSALMTALVQKRKFLLHIGEEHKCWRSFFLNSIILAISTKLGIKNAMLEWDADRMKLMEDYMKSEEHQNYIANYDTAIAQLKRIQSLMRIVLIDTFQAPGFDGVKSLSYENQKERADIMELPENVDKRNKTMIDNINKTGEDSILLIGAAHLQGFIEDHPPDDKIYYQISFSTIGTLSFGEFLDNREEMEIFPFISDKVIKLQLIGNLLGYTTSRVTEEVENAIAQYVALREDIDFDKSNTLSDTSRLIIDHLNDYQNEALMQTISRKDFKNQKIAIYHV